MIRDEFRGPGALGRLLFSALRLDPASYRRVAETPEATHICLATAAVSGVARALTISASAGTAGQRTFGLVLLVCVVVALMSAALDALLIWGIGRWILRRGVAYASVLRPVALAFAPSILKVLASIDSRWIAPVLVASELWLLLALAVAVRAALGTSWAGAAAVTLTTALIHVGMGSIG